jgi:hypothetical protein
MDNESKTKKERSMSKRYHSNNGICEVVAGLFCSKRYTGQFEDLYEVDEIEPIINGQKLSAISTKQNQASAESIVHDFDESDDLMEWPSDFDEAVDSF